MFIIVCRTFPILHDNYSELHVTAKHRIATSNEFFDKLRNQYYYKTMHNKDSLKILIDFYRISYTFLKVNFFLLVKLVDKVITYLFILCTIPSIFIIQIFFCRFRFFN